MPRLICRLFALSILLWTLPAGAAAAAPKAATAIPDGKANNANSVAAPISALTVPEPATTSTSLATQEQLQQVLHGIYMEMRVGMGYGIVGSKIPADPTFPDLTGASEALGLGALVDFALGWDLGDHFALQLVGGTDFLTSRREDRARASGLLYGGLGAKVAIPMDDRWVVNLAPNIAYAYVDDRVSSATGSVAVIGSVGFEYFVHVRHFSIGADLTATVPFSPLRAFLAVAPFIRYTF